MFYLFIVTATFFFFKNNNFLWHDGGIFSFTAVLLFFLQILHPSPTHDPYPSTADPNKTEY